MNEKRENPEKASVVEVDNEASLPSVSTIISSKESSLLQEHPSALGVESGAALTQPTTMEEQKVISNEKVSNYSQKTNSKNNLSYANAIVRSTLPTFNQSVIINGIDGFTNDQYMDEFEKHMDINNLLSFSKISENRVCFTLNSEAAANQLLSKTITVNDRVFNFMPLLPGRMIHKHRRIVVSNIMPQIPNDIVIDYLKSLNISTKNGITNIRCSTSNESRKHVLSHRRQFYIKEEDFDKIPPKIKINYQDISYWIFFGSDDIKCHFCQKPGHIVKFCPDLNKEAETDKESLDDGELTQKAQPASNDDQVNPESQNNSKMESEPTQAKEVLSHKRPASSVSSDSFAACQTLNTHEYNSSQSFKPPLTRQIKRIKPNGGKKTDDQSSQSNDSQSEADENSDGEEDITGALTPIQIIYEQKKFHNVLEFDQLVTFLKQVKHQRDVLSISKKFSTDTLSLINWLTVVESTIQDKKLKNRLKSF